MAKELVEVLGEFAGARRCPGAIDVDFRCIFGDVLRGV